MFSALALPAVLVMAPFSSTSWPVATRVMSPAALIPCAVTVPPQADTGPFTVSALAMVMSAVLVVLPSVRPPRVPDSVRLASGQVSALVKLLPSGCTVSLPVVSSVVADRLTWLAVSVMLLLLDASDPLPQVPPIFRPVPPTPLMLMSPLAAARPRLLATTAPEPLALVLPLRLMPPLPDALADTVPW